jgi:hypothetical protein
LRINEYIVADQRKQRIGSKRIAEEARGRARRIFGELAGGPALGIGTHFGGRCRTRRQDVEARRVMSGYRAAGRGIVPSSSLPFAS